MNKFLFVFMLVSFWSKGQSQNFISNPGFSDVKKIKKASLTPYKIKPANTTDIESWYLPGYIKYFQIINGKKRRFIRVYDISLPATRIFL